MSEGVKSHKKLYWGVFVALALLTALELWVPEWDTTTELKGGMLIFLAAVKAWFVAYFFMHLNEETRWMKFIAAVPLTAAVYCIVLVLETLGR